MPQIGQSAVPNDDEDLDPDATTTVDADPNADPAAAGEGEGEGDDPDADDEVVVQIGDEPPPGSEGAGEQDDETAKPWVRELRQKQRELVRENRELKAAAQRGTPAPETAPEIGEEPTLESSDFDADKFKRDLLAWHKRKADVDAAQQKREKEAKDANDSWQARLADHAKAAKALKVKDFEDVEEEVKTALSVVQQGILVQGAANSALLTYAIGKNPAKLKALAAITDPVKFAFAVAKLETEVKVTTRNRQTPPPESRVRGGSASPAVGAVDKQLARLETEAERTGDRSKVIAYKREKRERDAKKAA